MAETLPHIAVVDDEPDLRRAVAAYLAWRGCRVTDAAVLRALLARETVDVVVLDINMPGDDGLSLARWLRTQPLAVGIVMLTGNDDLADRVVGLEMGADDYMTKPFEPSELLARVRALLRRMGLAEGLPQAAAADPVVRVGRARFDPRSGMATDAQGRPLALTRNEQQVLALLVRQPHQAVAREALLHAMREDPLQGLRPRRGFVHRAAAQEDRARSSAAQGAGQCQLRSAAAQRDRKKGRSHRRSRAELQRQPC